MFVLPCPQIRQPETDPSRPRKGIIAFQLHQGEQMEVRVANIRIKRLR